jgi:hydrogenase expression/formation protein HypE
VIGAVTSEPVGMVLLETALGGERIVEIPLGEDLPRIC